MSTQVQYRRGSNVQVAAFTGALGEIVVDTTNKVLVVNDGSTVGGFPQVGLTATQTITNKVYNGTSVSVSGNVVGGNVTTAGLISATGNITSAGNISGSYLLGNAYFVSGLSPTKIYNGTTEANIGTASGNANISVGGTSNVAVFATTGVFVTGLVSATSNITGGNLISTGTITTAGNIVSSAANATANIGSATTYFNTVHAKATSAQYADVAEIYVADDVYEPGTVLDFGGDQEVTASRSSHSIRVAGVVSTNPAYIMNATQAGTNLVQLALLGRVPCKVVGPVRKGDRLVASHVSGVAQSLDVDQYEPGCIVGKALENYDSTGIGTIEAVVGRV